MNEIATYIMVCTKCGFSRATTDITEIHGIAPAFCACGEIMVPEIAGPYKANIQKRSAKNERGAK